MKEKPTASQTVGLQLDSDSLKGAELTLKQGKPALVRVFEIKIAPPEEDGNSNVKLLYTEDQKRELKRIVDHNLSVTGLHASDVLIRHMEINLTKSKDIDAVLDFQVEPLLPYPVEEANVDRIIQSKTEENSLLTVITARQDFISHHLEIWQSINIEPEVVSCIPAALANFSKLFASAQAVHLIVNIGVDTTTCVLANNGVLLGAQLLKGGHKQIIEAIVQDKGCSEEEAAKVVQAMDFSHLKTPTLASVYENFKLNITRLLLALGKQIKEEEVSDLFITGVGGSLGNLAETLSKSLKKSLVIPSETQNFDISIETLQKYAIPIGLALGALPQAKSQLNFRQKEFAYPYPWKRLKQPLSIYLALCFALAFTFYFYGNASVKRKESQLTQEYVELLRIMKTPYSEFESKFKGKNEIEVAAINLTQNDIKQRLSLIEKELKETPDIFPLLPNTPKVSDILAWLSSDPKITGEGETNPQIQLTSFSYKMVKRPEINKRKEKYQAKIELEFTTPTPRYAREFHDSLLVPNDMVDPKGGVKWSAERGKYRASFTLKDRTYYPPRR